MNSGIYSITNRDNGKRYIGRTVNFEKRKTMHMWQLNNNRHFNNHLQRAWNKGEHLEFEIIERCPSEMCNEREVFWIEHFHAQDMRYGYNLCDGGKATAGYRFTDEQKKKISDSRKGYKCKPEDVQKRVDSLHKHMEDDPDFAKRLSAQKAERWKGKPSWNKGIPCPEWKKKLLSEKLKGKKITDAHKEKLKQLYSGEGSKTAKLKKSDVVHIRYRFLCGDKQADIAKDYPVTPQTIYDIIRNRRWKSVPNTMKELEALL